MGSTAVAVAQGAVRPAAATARQRPGHRIGPRIGLSCYVLPVPLCYALLGSNAATEWRVGRSAP
jgi:hypothetical protein